MIHLPGCILENNNEVPLRLTLVVIASYIMGQSEYIYTNLYLRCDLVILCPARACVGIGCIASMSTYNGRSIPPTSKLPRNPELWCVRFAKRFWARMFVSSASHVPCAFVFVRRWSCRLGRTNDVSCVGCVCDQTPFNCRPPAAAALTSAPTPCSFLPSALKSLDPPNAASSTDAPDPSRQPPPFLRPHLLLLALNRWEVRDSFLDPSW